MSFQFKQFKVNDDRCAMKVGTDGVLLGAWVNVTGAKTILDIGTGSGLIALILAQRTKAETIIDAVEIGEDDSQQANENVLNSPWPGKIEICQAAIQDFKSNHLYDLIVSNPPFFNNSLTPSASNRKAARHTSSLSYEDLLCSVSRLLSDKGTFASILPVKEGNTFITLAQFYGLYCNRQTAFFARDGKPQERWLFEFSRVPMLPVTGKLILFSGQKWSDEYKKLIFDFYLHPL
jgi:tRNA1Val (adenine37-N6)-methyltransferase